MPSTWVSSSRRRRARQSWPRPSRRAAPGFGRRSTRVTLVPPALAGEVENRAKRPTGRRASSGSFTTTLSAMPARCIPIRRSCRRCTVAASLGRGPGRRPGPADTPRRTTSLKSRPELGDPARVGGDAVEQGRRRSRRESPGGPRAVSTRNFIDGESPSGAPGEGCGRGLATAPAVRPEFLVEHLGGGGGPEAGQPDHVVLATRRRGSATATPLDRQRVRVAQHGGTVVPGAGGVQRTVPSTASSRPPRRCPPRLPFPTLGRPARPSLASGEAG